MNAASVQTRSLKQLLDGVAELPRDVEIDDLTQDGRTARPGTAFLAVRGSAEHGLKYAPQAVANGARAVLWEPAPGVVVPDLPTASLREADLREEIVVAPVPHLREHASLIADRFFDAPSQSLAVAGITGTNGKTTCAYLLAQALEAAGRPAAYLGTIGTGRPHRLVASALTTGDAVSVQRTLADMRATGARSVAMEVSSHALDQARVGAVRFRTAAFTNLTRDHLDYHGSMDSYGAAKARLFTRPELASRVINVDDAFGRQLAIDPRGRGRLIVTSRGHQSHARAAAGFVRAMHVTLSMHGIELEFDSSWGTGALTCPLVGDFNVENLLTVIAVLLDWDLGLDTVLRVLAHVHAAPGRMETFGGNHAPLAVVDYAHTPDALRKALSAARAHCGGRLAVVFGCGGDRDPGKRPLMGGIAAQLADEVVITDDNPRTEAPATIVAGIAAGIPAGKPFRVEHDRANAIRGALQGATERDVVLIAGKGHEDYQIYGHERRAFSDQKIVAAALAQRGTSGGSGGAA
jgi:UDP-N-acetylmuramoyl-L-alanyl-D-glutamate--2,6-diaminopimelate ligase